MKIISNKYITGILILAAGLIAGWLIKPSVHQVNESERDSISESLVHQIWTCSMHPQIRLEQPGKCPICGMDLIPLESENQGESLLGEGEISMSESAMKIAEIQTSEVIKSVPSKEVYLPGKIKADERRMASMTSRISGRIEKLHVNFTGQEVYQGQRLATIYSPDLVTAQKELFEAKKLEENNPSFYKAAINKLKLWDITDQQIEKILAEGEPQFYFDVLATQSGTVTKRAVTLGDYVKQGSELFEIANLNKIWIMLEAYEIDLPWITIGDQIKFSVASIPGREFVSTVTFIDPVINSRSRTASIRTEMANPGRILKPEMFVTGKLDANLPGEKEKLMIPKTSVLWTGKRAVVYVKSDSDKPVFSYREIELGPQSSNFYIVLSGLEEGEEVVSNGVFKIDAAAQLLGKKSMMNPAGGKTSAGSMPGMKMGSKADHPDHSQTDPESEVDGEFRSLLTSAYDKYLEIKDNLFGLDISKTKSSGAAMKASLDKIDMSLVKGDMHTQWMEILDKMNSSLNLIQNGESLEALRKAFSPLSDNIYNAITVFGINNRTVYYQFCPMADNNNGAFWLSQFEEIKNPYMSETMASCGELKATLNENK